MCGVQPIAHWVCRGSDMPSPGAPQRRTRHVLSEVERNEGKGVATILSELDGEKPEISNEWSGDGHGCTENPTDHFP